MKLSTSDVRKLLDFHCGGRYGASEAMVRMQDEGVAALCNILARQGVAYLADEVGLGKTMQALGVIAHVLHANPAGRVLVIAPRENVQNGWNTEFGRFHADVWRHGATQPLSLTLYPALRDWLPQADRGGVALLRHTSFARPVHVSSSSLHWAAATRAFAGIDTLELAPPDCDDDERSETWNLHFASRVNKWLARCHIEFDLVVVDEAQCLRNHRNQSNSILRKLLQGRVRRWLFLSATPAHSGIDNIATVMNEYPDSHGGRRIADTMLAPDDGYAALHEALSNYMIRRPRTFLVGNHTFAKTDYRHDDPKSLALTCESALDTLSVALVQKRLVDLLEKDGNRFRCGYMASFESLDDSLRNRSRPAVLADAGEEAAAQSRATDDFYVDPLRPRVDTNAPDAGFVQALNKRFLDSFNFNLPHPKIDGVERDLRRAAFGDRAGARVGGEKTLVFCRRISSVRVLRDRLIASYLKSVEARCLDYWHRPLDWANGFGVAQAEAPDDEALASEGDAPQPADSEVEDDGLSQVRVALRDKGWLRRFTSTFQEGQRNALAFEQNWFVHLCNDAGIEPDYARRRIPLSLCAEARAFATRTGKLQRRRRVRYLTWHALDRYAAEVFGFDAAQAERWRGVIRAIYPEEQGVYQRADAGDAQGLAADTDDLVQSSLWQWIDEFDKPGELALPDGGEESPGSDGWRKGWLWRQVLVNVLGQYMRLTDTAIDLHCADLDARAAGPDGEPMEQRFARWLLGDDIDARRLRRIWRDWVEQRDLILASGVGEKVELLPWKIASRESFDFLIGLDPAVGVTGGSRGQKRPLQQFNTPGMPWVMIGTDTIREGVNLHLFCDRVMHYGVAWTAGDLEQRIGRVDRYFSRIERRLNLDDQSRLAIHYPHLADTLERRQIDAIFERKAASALAVDGAPLFTGRDDGEIRLDELPRAIAAPVLVTRGTMLYGTAKHLRGEDE